MAKYRIFGDLLKEFSIVVDANSVSEAFDIARETEQHKWNEVESDVTVQPYDYEELVITATLHEYRGQIVEI